MHLAKVLSPVPWTHKIEPGDYYLEDHNAAELLWASRGFGEVKIFACQAPEVDPSKLWRAGSRVLVVRVGGFGDLLWLNPIYQRMRAAGVHVAHSCFARYANVLDGFIDEVVPYPLAKEDLERFDTVVWLENVIEGSPCLGSEHPADRLAKHLHAPAGLRRCAYQITGADMDFARQVWPRGDKQRICIQGTTSGITKNYPLIEELLAAIALDGYEVLLVGEPRQNAEPVPDMIFDCTQRRFTIRQSIAMASQCDAIVAADSLFVHIGHALEIPVVGLFGPFSAQTYMKDYRGIAMQGRGKCSPCSWHPRGTAFPPGGPCAKTGYCTALANIPPRDVLFMLKQLLK